MSVSLTHLIRMTSFANPTRLYIAHGHYDVTFDDVTFHRGRLGARRRIGNGTFAIDSEAQKASAVRSSAELVEIVVEHRHRELVLSLL